MCHNRKKITMFFVETADSLDDHPGIQPSKIDCAKLSEAMAEAARRAIHLAPGEYRYLDFVRPLRYIETVTETVALTPDTESLTSHRDDIITTLTHGAIHTLKQMPQYDGASFDIASITGRGNATIVGSTGVKTEYAIWVNGRVVAGRRYDNIETAMDDVKNLAANTDALPMIEIKPGLTDDEGYHPRFTAIHETYDVAVNIKLPLIDETPQYIIFGKRR